MNQEEMVALWEQHTAYEFVSKDPYASIVFQQRFGSGARHVRRPVAVIRGMPTWRCPRWWKTPA
ncbi:hypothetical protein [Streptomyces sp. NPDC058247]|uniref:hypothetical protein n=1 Tax=Streptomyces sp. NPDC058247 TaxID=3346401 RepID=UPI0036E1BE97